MKLKQMKVKGLGSYAIEQTIDFSIDNDSRITVFHGENGAGKTSTLNAILWGLTGQVAPGLIRRDQGEQKDLIINEQFVGGDDLPQVEVTFQHEGCDYKAIRILKSNIDGDFQLWKKVGGIYDPLANQSRSIMSKILPSGLARYFIFDGEGFAKSAEHSTSKFKTSVEEILGFDFVKRAIERIKLVRKSKNTEFQKIISRKISDQRARNKYQIAVEQIEDATEVINRETKKLETIKEALGMISVEIAALDISRVQNLQKQKTKITKDLTFLNSNLQYQQDQRVQLISKYYRVIFGSKIISESFAVIESFRQKKVIPGPFNKQFIKDLIDSGVCICGECLDDMKVERLMQQLSKGYTNSLQNRLTRAQAVTTDDMSKISDFQKEFQELTISISDSKTQIDNKKEELSGIENELDELAGRDEKLKELRNKEVIENANKRRSEDKCDEARRVINTAEIVRNKFNLKSSTPDQQENSFRQQIENLDRIIKYGTDFLNTEMTNCHSFVKKELQNFINGTNIPYNVHLDSNFQFFFKTDGGKSISGSTGEQKTLEFAFLCSLVRLVKNKSEDKDSLLMPSGSLPLVIDAPFSDIAERYVKYISDMLLLVSDQLTILTINKDWPALEQATEGKVGKEYLLIKHIVQSSEDRTQEHHTFRDKDYICVKYNAKFNHTTVQEVSYG